MTSPSKFGVAHLAQISMREFSTHKAQLVSQLLFGDAYQVLEEVEEWLKIKTLDCDYEGFIDAKLYNPLHEDDAATYQTIEKYLVTDYFLAIQAFETNVSFPIFMGSTFPFPNDGMLILGDAIFMVQLPEPQPMLNHPTLTEQQVKILQFSSGYLRAPYLWGGRTPAGIDCSALVQLVFKSIGISLPRDASQQVLLGDPVDFCSEWQVGDVAFFENELQQISHVGIVCGKDKILHASGFVRIDSLDTTGIFNKDVEKYTHNLRVVKRLLG